MHDTVAQRGSVSYDQLGDEEREEVQGQVNLFIDRAIPEIQVRQKHIQTKTLMLYSRNWYTHNMLLESLF